MRVALGVEYDGTAFHGWQTQSGVRTVQDELERALAKLADHPIGVTVAGRTDAGVHGIGQVVHFDTEARRQTGSWVLGTNSFLPRDICVLWARPVEDAFHARFSAIARRYRYLILNRGSRPALLRSRVTWEFRALDADRMAAAARHLVGEHDFSAFRAQECQAKSPVRTLHHLDARREGDFISIDAEANGFLHHMVRNIAGVLMSIGMGKAEPEWADEVLQGRDRARGGVTAPASGLYLMQVRYPPHYRIPAAKLDSPLP